jgi:hypothetical protein
VDTWKLSKDPQRASDLPPDAPDEEEPLSMRTDPWRRVIVLLTLALSAFAFNTTENLPIGLLRLISADLDVSLPSVGYASGFREVLSG